MVEWYLELAFSALRDSHVVGVAAELVVKERCGLVRSGYPGVVPGGCSMSSYGSGGAGVALPE